MTRILPEPLIVRAATLWYPDRSQTPIAATIDFVGAQGGGQLSAEMDWRSPNEIRSIDIMTTAGQRVWLPTTGHRLEVDGKVLVDEGNLEYRRLYSRFAELIGRRDSEVDDMPLIAVADACLLGCRKREDEAGGGQPPGSAFEG